MLAKTKFLLFLFASFNDLSYICTEYLNNSAMNNSVVYKEPEVELTEEEKYRELLSLAGCWADDPEDAARMEAAIKDGRKNEYMLDVNLDD